MDDTGGSGNNRCGRHVGPAKSPFENLFLDTTCPLRYFMVYNMSSGVKK